MLARSSLGSALPKCMRRKNGWHCKGNLSPLALSREDDAGQIRLTFALLWLPCVLHCFAHCSCFSFLLFRDHQQHCTCWSTPVFLQCFLTWIPGTTVPPLILSPTAPLLIRFPLPDHVSQSTIMNSSSDLDRKKKHPQYKELCYSCMLLYYFFFFNATVSRF